MERFKKCKLLRLSGVKLNNKTNMVGLHFKGQYNRSENRTPYGGFGYQAYISKKAHFYFDNSYIVLWRRPSIFLIYGQGPLS